MSGGLYVAHKPLFVASNNYLSRLKRHFGIKKAGFSGTLDPFAVGTLVVATGNHTRLLPYLSLEPKVYRATLWLGAKSDTFDLEGVEYVNETLPLHTTQIQEAVSSLCQITSIIPPAFSAKRIQGKRAYELARQGKEVALQRVPIRVFSATLIAYSHPFITFDVAVSKGTYVRTLGQVLAEKLHQIGSLSFLYRQREGKFVYRGLEKENIEDALALPQNIYTKDKTDIILGKKLDAADFSQSQDGTYLVNLGEIYCILRIVDSKVEYLVNHIDR